MSAGRKINTSSQSWGTPHKYIEAVKKVLGRICLDPCSNEYSVVDAEVEYILPKHDGLKDSWNYSTIYVNPPYGIWLASPGSRSGCFQYCTLEKICIHSGKGSLFSIRYSIAFSC